MKSKLLSDAWQDVVILLSADQRIPLSPLQLRYLRRAFYAGAEFMLREMHATTKAGPDFSPDAAKDRLNSLVLEITTFRDEIRKGKA